MHHGTCVTHVPWCMSGSLTDGGGENVPDIPGGRMHNAQFYVSCLTAWRVHCHRSFLMSIINVKSALRYSKRSGVCCLKLLCRRLWINVNDINNRLTICHVYNILIVLSAHEVHICKYGFMFHGLFCENLTRNVPVFPIVHCWNQINLELMYINDFNMWLIPLIIYMKIPLRLYLDQYLAYLVSSNAMWISKRFSLTYVSLLVWVWLIRVIIHVV